MYLTHFILMNLQRKKIEENNKEKKKKMSSSSSRNAFVDGKYKPDLLTVDLASRCRCYKTTPSSSLTPPPPPKSLLVATPVEEGEYPVVMLLHGYLLYNSFYSQLMLHVSSHGFIVIAPQVQFYPTI